MIISKNFIRKNRIFSHGKYIEGKIDVFEFLFECDFCKKKFIKIGTYRQLKYKKFCSHKCSIKFNISFRDNKKLSKSLKKYYKENNVWNKGLTKQNNQSLKTMSDKLTGRTLTVEIKNKISLASIGKKNHFWNKKHTNQAKEKISKSKSESISNGNYNFNNRKKLIKGFYYSNKNNDTFYYDSFWELIRMKILDIDDRVLKWTKKHKIRIPYVYESIERNYIPDFLITYKTEMVLEEIKGYEEELKKQIKFRILKEYCNNKKINFNILLYKDINKLSYLYFNKSINVLREEFKCVF